MALEWLPESSALVVAATLSYAAVSKARTLPVFREQIADYQLLPYRLTRLAAVFIVASEASSAILLLVPPTRRLGAALALLLFGIFLVGVGNSLARGLRISCGCFGPGGKLDLIGPPTLARVLWFGCLSLIAALPFDVGWNVGLVGGTAILAVTSLLIPEVVRAIGDTLILARTLRSGEVFPDAMERKP